jgi:DNA-binding NtrC family response regulator
LEQGSSFMETILLVEDKPELREMLTHALGDMQFEVTAATNLETAVSALQKQRFSAVLTDLKLPAGSGMDVLQAALESDPATPVILMTAYGTITQAVEAMRSGAYDFIQKPIDLNHLEQLLRRAIERQQLQRENIVLKEVYAQRYGFPRIVGEHPSLQAAANAMQKIAQTDTTVLLLGESGTGKELFARAIHQLSPRAQKPMLSINCAAIPEPLLENELFGHEKGAFTGADTRRAGKFELAHGGTIFLDEIGELPAGAQAKLLRVLEERTVERLGGSASIRADVRVIAATNRDLQAAAEAGDFRKDLYFRLSVFPINIPPLRDRVADIPVLAEYFLDRFRRELRKPRLSLNEDAITAMQNYSWPGNVRELSNLVERMTILHDGEITAADLGLSAQKQRKVSASQPAPEKQTEEQATAGAKLADVSARAVAEVERTHIESVLRSCKWNKNAAAEQLGISYKTLLNKLHAYGLD